MKNKKKTKSPVASFSGMKENVISNKNKPNSKVQSSKAQPNCECSVCRPDLYTFEEQ